MAVRGLRRHVAVHPLIFALEPFGLNDPHEQALEVLTTDDVGAA